MPRLRVGAAASVVTPPLGTQLMGFFNERLAEDVHDDLLAKAFVFESGDIQLAIVICDLIVLLAEDLAVAKRRACDLTGIPVENILVSATHTHYGPATAAIFNTPRDDEYTAWAMARIGDSVKLAQNRLAPARVGHESGMCPEETHNRRYRMRAARSGRGAGEARQDATVQMNPGYQNPDIISPAGPIDPEVGVLALEQLGGGTIGVIANYALHYVGGPYATTVSADYFGAFGRALQGMAGEEFVAAMANGCCGDINNVDVTRPAPEFPHPFYQMERVGQVVAAEALQAWRQIRDFDDEPPLAVAHAPMTFLRRRPTDEELAAAHELVDAGPDPENRDWVYANETVEVAKLPEQEQIDIQALAIGDLGIVALPGEAFVEYGLAIKRASPFRRTLTVELANGWLGYLATDRALKEGSYETRLARSACAAEGTEGAMIAAATEALQKAHEAANG